MFMVTSFAAITSLSKIFVTLSSLTLAIKTPSSSCSFLMAGWRLDYV
jgi:hypothetical protein